MMKKTIFIFVPVFLLFLSPLLMSQENKLKVTADTANIYINSEGDSPVIETLEKGEILTLLSKEKIRDTWYYVSFYSKEKAVTMSGFIYASMVEEMFEVPIDIKKRKQEPVGETEEVVYESPKKIQIIIELANLRAEPDFKSEIINQVQLGITLLAVEKTKEWYRVDLPPDEDGIIISGYIHQSFVKEIPDKSVGV